MGGQKARDSLRQGLLSSFIEILYWILSVYLLAEVMPPTHFGYNSHTKLILMKKFKKIILTGARDGGILCCAYGAAFGSVSTEYFCGGCFYGMSGFGR